MKQFYTYLFILFPIFGFSQNHGIDLGVSPDWSTFQTKAAGDSCGAYFNNYIGIDKTNILREEPLRTGSNSPDDGHYNGRAQRFSAQQPIEVSGVEFYAYIKNNPTQDSLMVITSLNEYDILTDSVGLEIIRDTVYVKYHAFTINLPNMSTKSYFDSPVTVTTDYIVSVFTPTNDSLFILANNPATNSGNGENLGYALYDNPAPGYASYKGWYAMLSDFAYDYDFLIAPLVKYDLHESFNVVNDTICPGVTSNGCVNGYTQVPVFSSNQYNSDASSPNAIFWNWGDGFFNTGITSACHTYTNSGTYTITLQDTLYKYDYAESYCLASVSHTIFAQDSVMPNFTYTQTSGTVDFVNTSSFADSVSWDFGDGNLAGNINSPQHIYDSIGTYDVWLHAYSECLEDSILFQVTTDDVGINEMENNISIYPNPANTRVNITNLPIHASVEIFNIVGELVTNENSSNTTKTIDITNLSTGTYYIKINTETQSFVKKLVVKH